MAAYCNEVRKLEDKFDGLELNHVARRFNEAADELAKAASGRMPVPDGVFVSDQLKPSIHYPEPAGVGSAPPVPDPSADPEEINAALLESAPEADPSDPVVMEITAAGANPPVDWRAQYLNYLVRGTLPADKTEARRITHRAKSFTIIDQELYKRSHTGILQHCIPIEQGKALIQDIHAGACGHHAAPRTLVGNAFRQGFYWPTAVADATQVVRTCEGCQFFARQTHLPAQALQTIPITWPFAVWGLDLFTGKRFLQIRDDHHIRVDWAAVAHPRTNGQVERANGMILQGLKPRIFDRLKKFGGRWVAELPVVLWSLRTTPSWATGFTPCKKYKDA
ncbi:uncharacterized protein LOC111257054 [Setaria italica]|uniref:uncharacterized protein LOC111257054 n=1 Tax=Setaria italica TaxID=4555 RepID=UPI000BE4C78E|nr:uncharacterized protein LOC111257054 [Setaria italica]